jgi:hypothetical protein
VLGENDLCQSLLIAFFVVVLVAIDEHNEIRILLDTIVSDDVIGYEVV